jgi:hypothetical protein
LQVEEVALFPRIPAQGINESFAHKAVALNASQNHEDRDGVSRGGASASCATREPQKLCGNLEEIF